MIATPTQRFVIFCALTMAFFVALSLVDSFAAPVGLATRENTSPRSSSRSRNLRGSSSKSGSQKVRRLREGTLVSDQSGFFREDGEGATFVTDDGMEFGSLPNLNLERVVRLLKSAEESSSIRWSVTGRVTEFSGRNFLLISRAVYKSATPPPTPEQLVPSVTSR